MESAKYEADDSDLQIVVSKLVSLVEDLSDSCKMGGVENALLKGIDEGSHLHLCSKLKIQVKSHKKIGEVAMRPLHCSVEHPFKPTMRFLCYFLVKAIAEIQHIVRDTDDLILRLSTVHVVESDLF